MRTLCSAAGVALAACFFIAAPVHSTSLTTDQSDLWWIPSESGWGMQLVHRGPVIFATLFVYGLTGNPTWYTATLDSTATNLTWTGDLYATTGPYFETIPFNPMSVTVTKVGTLTWAAQTIDTGTLSYVVDGVAVTKNVERQTLVVDNFNGVYLGAFHITAIDCKNPSSNGSADIPSATFTVVQSGASISVAIVALTTITISGSLSQSGQFGNVVGTFTSSAGLVGNATVSAMNVQIDALSASFSLDSTNLGCQSTGYLAGIRSMQ
jgi:hypothetical protein